MYTNFDFFEASINICELENGKKARYDICRSIKLEIPEYKCIGKGTIAPTKGSKYNYHKKYWFYTRIQDQEQRGFIKICELKNGKRLEYNFFSSKTRSIDKDLNLKYIGKGICYSINGIEQNNSNNYWFFVNKKEV